MKWVCRRCLTAFSSEDILNHYIDRCQKQQPTNITFNWKDHLKFEDYHMKVRIPIRVYADLNVLFNPQSFTQIQQIWLQRCLHMTPKVTPKYYLNKF